MKGIHNGAAIHGRMECITLQYQIRIIFLKNSKLCFFFQLYDRLPEGEAPSASNVVQSFSALYGKDETEEVFGEDSEYDENRKVL